MASRHSDRASRALDPKIVATTKQLEETKHKAERDRVGQLLEQEADKVEEASQALDKTAKQFASAYQQLRSAMIVRYLGGHPLRQHLLSYKELRWILEIAPQIAPQPYSETAGRLQT